MTKVEHLTSLFYNMHACCTCEVNDLGGKRLQCPTGMSQPMRDKGLKVYNITHCYFNDHFCNLVLLSQTDNKVNTRKLTLSTIYPIKLNICVHSTSF